MPRDRQRSRCQCGGGGEAVYRDRQRGDGSSACLSGAGHDTGERGRETLEMQTKVRGGLGFLGEAETDRRDETDQTNRHTDR